MTIKDTKEKCGQRIKEQIVKRSPRKFVMPG